MKIQFGKSSNINGSPSDRKFGLFKFGQPYHFYIYETLLRYLPKFVTQSNVCKKLMKSIAISLIRWQFECHNIINVLKTGNSGFKYANEDLQIFTNNNVLNETLRNYVINYFSIHKKRGTSQGILEDIVRLSNDKNINIQYYNADQCGWWLDITFPGYTENDMPNLYYSNCYIDLDKLIDISVKNNSGLDDKTFANIILNELIPITMGVRLTIIKPHIIKFGDFKHKHLIQFGNIKFGDIL